ncbi:MAG TPA: universal stress protein [Myxococcales bacterium]|nr:universal stress protein [Myxococcales bacterium]
MKPIMVAVDGSEPSLKGLRVAAELSRATSAPLLLVHVVSPVALPVPLSPEIAERLEAGERAHADFVVSRSLSEATSLEAKADGLVIHGGPAEALSDTADSRDCSMVVIGSRGRGGVARVLLGSVADRLVHICKKPVLVVK